MKSILALMGLCASLTTLACGGSTTTPLATDGGTDGAPANDGATGGDANVVPDAGLNCNAATVNLTFASCPATPTCGGTIVDGTYDYTSGCVADPFAQATKNCPTLQVTNEKGTVQGCITFASNTVTRNVQSTYSATLDVPTSCLLGVSCQQLQAGLKSAFNTATCSSSSTGCTCNVSTSYSGVGGATYSTSNNQIVTSSNNHYDYCVNGTSMDIQWASGNAPEPGVYTVTKQ